MDFLQLQWVGAPLQLWCARASHCGGLLQCTVSRCPGFSNCGSQAQAMKTQQSVREFLVALCIWDLPDQVDTSPALAGQTPNLWTATAMLVSISACPRYALPSGCCDLLSVWQLGNEKNLCLVTQRCATSYYISSSGRQFNITWRQGSVYFHLSPPSLAFSAVTNAQLLKPLEVSNVILSGKYQTIRG